MDSLLTLDKELFLALNFDGGSFLDNFFWIVSGKLTWAPLYILIIVLLWRRFGWKYTLLAVVFIAMTMGIVDQVADFFKDNLPKLRPSHNPEFEGEVHSVRGYRGGWYGTVSAHAATTFSVMMFSSSLLRTRWFTIMTVLWASLVSYSRIYLGVHYPLDILFGAILGIVTALLTVKLFRWVVKRWCDRGKNIGATT